MPLQRKCEYLVATSQRRGASIWGSFETLNLSLPFVLVSIALLLPLVGVKLDSLTKDIAFLVHAYLFLNASHVILTLFLIASLPEARRLIAESWRRRANWIYISLLSVVVLPIIKYADFITHFGRWQNFLVFAIPNIFLYRHAIKQTYGLSLLYNARADTNLSNAGRLKTYELEEQERKFFKAIIFFTVLQSMYRLMPIPAHGYLKTTLSVFTFLPAIMIFWNGLKYEGPLWSNKKTFLARIFLYPLSGFSFLLGFALGAVHGMEYFFLTIKIVLRSHQRNKALLLTIALALVIAIVAPQMIYKAPKFAGYFWSHAKDWPLAANGTIVALFFTLDFLHFYLDGILFRMSDPLTRECMGPLLGLAKLHGPNAGPNEPYLAQARPPILSCARTPSLQPREDAFGKIHQETPYTLTANE